MGKAFPLLAAASLFFEVVGPTAPWAKTAGQSARPQAPRGHRERPPLPTIWESAKRGEGCAIIIFPRHIWTKAAESMKETAMGEGWWCGLHYGDLCAAADAAEGRRIDAGRWPTRIGLTSRWLAALDGDDCCAI